MTNKCLRKVGLSFPQLPFFLRVARRRLYVMMRNRADEAWGYWGAPEDATNEGHHCPLRLTLRRKASRVASIDLTNSVMMRVSLIRSS